MGQTNLVSRSRSFALRRSFLASCDPLVGQLLAVLAGGVRRGGRILEIGTGGGVGTAWLTTGAPRGASIETIEADADLSSAVASLGWPAHVTFRIGNAVELLPEVGTFDLVFADAEGGKWYGLESTLETVAVGGLLVVDDMRPPRWESDRHRSMTEKVRDRLCCDERLMVAELECSTGVIIARRLK